MSMIKIIAFDLVGVLVTEKDIELSSDEDKIERLFGQNISDVDFMNQVKEVVKKDIDVMNISKNIINKLYQVREEDVVKKIKDFKKDVKVIIATNHISPVREFIENNFSINSDDIIISAEINKVKPNKDFYEYVIDKYNIKPEELLFIDDNQVNIDSANELCINTIKINKDTNITETVLNYLK